MPEMAVAALTRNRRPLHAEGIVRGRLNGAVQRRPEARPTRAAVEFCLRGEQREFAARAAEYAIPVLVQQRTAERIFRAGLTQHVVLGRRQQLAPFGVGADEMIGRGQNLSHAENFGDRGDRREGDEFSATCHWYSWEATVRERLADITDAEALCYGTIGSFTRILPRLRSATDQHLSSPRKRGSSRGDTTKR